MDEIIAKKEGFVDINAKYDEGKAQVRVRIDDIKRTALSTSNGNPDYRRILAP